MSQYFYVNHSLAKLYDLGSGYLGEEPIAKAKLGDKWVPVYSAECLLITIEKKRNLEISFVEGDVERKELRY